MNTVSKRELNQHTAEVLARATAAHDIVVTERGTARWRISMLRDDDRSFAPLERAGHYRPPSATPTPWPDAPGGPAYADDEVEALLTEVRGEH